MPPSAVKVSGPDTGRALLIVEVCLGHRLLQVPLSLVYRLLEGDGHDAKVGLELEAGFLEVLFFAMELLGCFEEEQTMGLKALPNQVGMICLFALKHVEQLLREVGLLEDDALPDLKCLDDMRRNNSTSAALSCTCRS